MQILFDSYKELYKMWFSLSSFFCVNSNFRSIWIANNMFLRKYTPKTTRQSSKGKKPTIEVSEIAEIIDSYMEVTPNHYKLMIQLAKLDIEPTSPIFKDIKAFIDMQLLFPRWSDIYRKFTEKDYLDVLPPGHPIIKNIDEFVFSNIKRSHLHIVSTRALVMPYLEVIEWITTHTDTENIIVINDEGKCIASLH
jgi:hypothetical protein